MGPMLDDCSEIDHRQDGNEGRRLSRLSKKAVRSEKGGGGLAKDKKKLV